MQSLDRRMRERITENGRGWYFTPNAFPDVEAINAPWTVADLERLINSCNKKGVMALAQEDDRPREPSLGVVPAMGNNYCTFTPYMGTSQCA